MDHPRFMHRYGPWAVVAGASEGLGEAFARGLAARGFHLILFARRQAVLDDLAAELRAAHGVEVIPKALDLSDSELEQKAAEAMGERDIGLLVYNAALSCIGPFHDHALDRHLMEVDVNVRGPLTLAYMVSERLRPRKKGGIILMSSASGFHGTGLVANYAATKAYNTILAEGLWYELRPHGIDVLACVAGATRTPNYESSQPKSSDSGLLRPQSPEDVVEEALEALGKQPTTITGMTNRLGMWLMNRLMPRRAAIRTMSRATHQMYG